MLATGSAVGFPTDFELHRRTVFPERKIWNLLFVFRRQPMKRAIGSSGLLSPHARPNPPEQPSCLLSYPSKWGRDSQFYRQAYASPFPYYKIYGDRYWLTMTMHIWGRKYESLRLGKISRWTKNQTQCRSRCTHKWAPSPCATDQRRFRQLLVGPAPGQ